MELDRISNLPSPLMEKILSCLPIKEAVRTSVLSSQWRYSAATLQHLVFDYQCHSAYKDTTFADIVDHVLKAHIGPIHKFKLSRDQLAKEDIDRWILHLSKNSIKEFIFHPRLQRFVTPSCLFSCQAIISLELSCCLLKPPSTFKGFRSLKSLHFQDVIISDDVCEQLINSCPVLESLTLVYCNNVNHLLIDAPNLKFLDVRGHIKDVLLVNTSNLVDVSIGLEALKFYASQRQQVSGSSSNLVKILSCLPQVQRLDFYCCSLKYLAIGALPVELPSPCLYVISLHITLNLNSSGDSLTALCLFRSCPALQELKVQVLPGEDVVRKASSKRKEVVRKGNSWSDGSRRCSFNQLRYVFINDIGDVNAELDFIRYLLKNAPVLERMTLQPAPGVESRKLKSSAWSRHAKIIILDQCKCL